MMPIPPKNIKLAMMNCPNPDQYVPVLTNTRPVTHAAEVAVKIASRNEAASSETVDRGIRSNNVPRLMREAKPPANMKRALVFGGRVNRRRFK